jgi:sulfoxide reductase heme-binding subunit YedZ
MLHRLVYLAAVAGVIHFWWLVKADISEPRFYAIVLSALFVARLVVAARRAGRPTWLAGSRASTSPTR